MGTLSFPPGTTAFSLQVYGKPEAVPRFGIVFLYLIDEPVAALVREGRLI